MLSGRAAYMLSGRAAYMLSGRAAYMLPPCSAALQAAWRTDFELGKPRATSPERARPYELYEFWLLTKRWAASLSGAAHRR